MTAHKVGNFNNGQAVTDVSKQWIARPADQKFTSLGALRGGTRGAENFLSHACGDHRGNSDGIHHTCERGRRCDCA